MIFNILNPEYRYSKLTEITPEWVLKSGYTALLVDIDNTLLARNCNIISETHIRWLTAFRRQGIPLALTSNNGGRRTAAIRKQLEQNGLDIQIFSWAGKPFPRAFSGAIRLLEGPNIAKQASPWKNTINPVQYKDSVTDPVQSQNNTAELQEKGTKSPVTGGKDNHTAVILAIGDQLFTDVLGAHLYGLPAAWVRPLSKNDFIGTKLLRILESLVAGYLQQNGMLPEEDIESRDKT